MKKLSVKKMQNVKGGYCDPVIYQTTGVCTNPGCLVTIIWNTATDLVGLPPMYCMM